MLGNISFGKSSWRPVSAMGWIEYLNLWMMKWVFFHHATAANEVSNQI